MPELVSTVGGTPSGEDERAGEFHLVAYRFTSLRDVAYEHRTFVFGGPVLAAVTAVLSAVGNRRRRLEAQKLAAPQWRELGPVRVRVMADRLLVFHLGAWWSVWFCSVVEGRLDPQGRTLELYFADDAPYRLAGSDVRRLAVVLTELRHVVAS